MPLNDSNIDSGDNFHNDDSVNAVEDVAAVPEMCRGVCVAGVKCTAGRQTEQLDEYQGPACAGSNQITENGDKLQRYSAVLKFATCNYWSPDKSLEVWDTFRGRWKSFRVEGGAERRASW